MIAEWARKYVGIPYVHSGRTTKGIDCLGLLYLIYSDDFGYDLPDYNNYTHSDYSTIESVFKTNISQWERIEWPEVGCLIMFNIAGHTTHLGVFVGDGRFIHALDGSDCTIERVDSIKWRGRIEGFYKWNV
jgi:cell wall-associated NlpC family hydrolase